MKRIRQDIRLSKEEKQILETQANDQGMTVTEYVKYMLFEQNPELSKKPYIYHCPSGERYNYVMAGLSMTNYLLLEALVQHLYKDKSADVMKSALSSAIEKLEKLYSYTRTEVKRNE
jgi:predicted DNA-binding protein